jgi:ParB family transcriptional regulator, chromosome partitioning protein
MPIRGSLGKGIGALLPDLLDDISTKPSFITCGIEELSPNRFQARKDFNDIEQKRLVSSIKKNGIIQPIIVRKSATGYEIIAGERRWRAAQQAGIKNVPIIIREAQDVDAAEISLIENIQRENLNSIEEAEAYTMLIEKFDIKQDELSNRVGKDRSTISNTIRLLKLPQNVKQALRNKVITAGHARSLLALDSPSEQLQVFHTIQKKSLSVRDTERLIQNMKKNVSKQKSLKTDASLLDLEKSISRCLMTAVHISRGKKSGKIEIKFKTTEELNRLIALLASL